MTLSIRVSSSSTTTFIIFFCKLTIIRVWNWKKQWWLSVLRLLNLQPASALTAAFFFSLCDGHDYIFFNFSFLSDTICFWRKKFCRKHGSQTGYFSFGVAQKITCWFENCKKKLRCQLLFHVTWLTSAKAFHIDDSLPLERKTIIYFLFV